MSSAGSTLRQKREAEGLPVEEIAARLCIAPSYLRAIEDDDVSCLPGMFFYRSFALQYAAFLRADDVSLRNAIEEVCALRQDSDEALLARRARPFIQVARCSPGRTVYAIAVGAVLCAGAAFSLWRQELPPLRIVGQANLVAPTMPAAAAAPEQAEPAPGGSGAVLNLAARETTWLSITSGGVAVFEGFLWASQSKTLTGLEMAQMRVGNAGGLDVFWNGKPVGPLGASGQVRVVLLSGDGVRVLPPGRTL